MPDPSPSVTPTPSVTPSVTPTPSFSKIFSRPVDSNNWNPDSGTNGYYELSQLFTTLRSASGENSLSASPTGILSAGIDLSELFDPSMSPEDQISFLTGYTSLTGGDHLLSGIDLKYIFRSALITPTPSTTPNPTPTPSSFITTAVTLSGEELVRWYGAQYPISLQSNAVATGGVIETYDIQVQYSTDGASFTDYSTFATLSSTNTLPASTISFPTSYIPNFGVGFYRFKAVINVNATPSSVESGIVAIIANNVTVGITAGSTTYGVTSATFTSIANSNNGDRDLKVHGFEWFNGSEWVNIGAYYPNTQASTQTLDHDAGSYGTYYYRAYASNCDQFQRVGTYQYSNVIAVTYSDIPVSVTPSLTPSPTPTPTPTPVSLAWVNQGLTSPPDAFSSSRIDKRFTSGITASYSAQLYNPGGGLLVIDTESTPQYGISFGPNTSLQIQNNSVINLAANYDGTITRSTSEKVNILTVSTNVGTEYQLWVYLPASCYWSAGDIISDDTYTVQSIWSSNISSYSTFFGTITNPNTYDIVLTVDSIDNSSGSVVWWQTNSSTTISQGSTVTVPAGSTLNIGYINPSFDAGAIRGSSEITFKGPNQLLNFKAQLFNNQEWAISYNDSLRKSDWFENRYVWSKCDPNIETVTGYNVIYIPSDGTYQFKAEVDDELRLYILSGGNIDTTDGYYVGIVQAWEFSWSYETPKTFDVYLATGVYIIKTVARNPIQPTGAGVAIELWNSSPTLIWSLRGGSSGVYLDNPPAFYCDYSTGDYTYGGNFTYTDDLCG